MVIPTKVNQREKTMRVKYQHLLSKHMVLLYFCPLFARYGHTDEGESYGRTDDESYIATTDDADSYVRTDEELNMRTDDEFQRSVTDDELRESTRVCNL